MAERRFIQIEEPPTNNLSNYSLDRTICERLDVPQQKKYRPFRYNNIRCEKFAYLQ